MTVALIISCTYVAFAYQSVDSIKSLLNKSINDSSKIEVYNELAWQLRKRDGDQALHYARQALTLASTKNRQSDIATSLNRIGEVYRLRGQYEEAMQAFKEALEIEFQIKNAHGIARASSQLGTIYKNLGRYDSAELYAIQSLKFFKKSNNIAAIGRSHSRVSTVYREKGQFGNAIAHSDSALSIQIERGSDNDIAHTYLSLGNLYKDLGYLDSALSQYRKSLNIRVATDDSYEQARIINSIGNIFYMRSAYDSALSYYKKSLYLKNSLGSLSTVDINYNNLGLVFMDQGNLDSALHYFGRSLAIKLANRDTVGMVLSYNNIGEIYHLSDHYDSALFYFERALDYSRSVNDLLVIMNVNGNLADLYSKLQNFDRALEFKNRYLQIRDTLDHSFRDAINVRNQYEREKQRRSMLQKDQSIKRIELSRVQAETTLKNMIIITLVFCLLAAILITIIYYRSKIRLLTLEKDRNAAEQKVDDLLKEQELRAMNAMIEGQEGERQRIAQDLHDRLGSMLSMVKIHFKSVEENIEDLRTQNKKQYEKANSLLDDACEEVRKIAHDMVSGVLTKFGLVAALKSLEKTVNQTGQLNMKVLDFGLDGERLNYDIEINLYRIIQELLSNVLKYAEASELTVQLIKKEHNLNLLVEDNGVGFELDQIDTHKGMGLQNIRYRVDKLHGEMQIDTGKGSGTTVTIDFSISK